MKLASSVFAGVAALAAVGASTSSRNYPDAWEPLRDGLRAWRALDFDADFAINVGTEEGRQFLYTTDDFTMQTEMEGASLSKWPAAVMISGLVSDGTMSYDDKVRALCGLEFGGFVLRVLYRCSFSGRANCCCLSWAGRTSGMTNHRPICWCTLFCVDLVAMTRLAATHNLLWLFHESGKQVPRLLGDGSH